MSDDQIRPGTGPGRARTNPAGAGLRAALDSWGARIARACGPLAAQRFVPLMLDTWETTMRWRQDRVFVITGDIPAMWLRDSSAQVLPFMRLIDLDEVARTIRGVVKEQWRCIGLDPYANAFNIAPDGAHFDPGDLDLHPGVWERKYEIDSLAFPVRLAHQLWLRTGDASHLDGAVHAGARSIVDLWILEQDHSRSTYRHVRPSEPADTLPHRGAGAPVAITGMTWSGFRPSDDAAVHGYNIPAQLMAVSALGAIAEVAVKVWDDRGLAARARGLAEEISHGVDRFGRDGERYLYEVDGLGAALAMDDANMPSLLSLPLVSDVPADSPQYLATRRWVLSQDNPFFNTGRWARGVGSPHTPPGYVWHIALAVEGLTGTVEEARACLETILATDAGTGMTHESFNPDDPGEFTRPWFSWSNSMACELMMDLTERS